jgi:hypothetical protein
MGRGDEGNSSTSPPPSCSAHRRQPRKQVSSARPARSARPVPDVDSPVSNKQGENEMERHATKRRPRMRSLPRAGASQKKKGGGGLCLCLARRGGTDGSGCHSMHRSIIDCWRPGGQEVHTAAKRLTATALSWKPPRMKNGISENSFLSCHKLYCTVCVMGI